LPTTTSSARCWPTSASRASTRTTRRIQFRGSSDVLAEGKGRTINAALVAFGGAFGILGLRQPRGCDGFQVSLFGAVFAQFNLDTPSFDLLNAGLSGRARS